MRNFHYLTLALVIIGALNWGLIGFFKFDLVAAIFGDMTILSRIVYSLVGVSALAEILYRTQGRKLMHGTAH